MFFHPIAAYPIQYPVEELPVYWDAVTAAETGGARGGKSKRIHPRYINDLEDELPEVIQKRRKLTKTVEAKLAKPVEVTLDPFQTKAELIAAFQKEAATLEAARLEKLTREQDEDDDWLILML